MRGCPYLLLYCLQGVHTSLLKPPSRERPFAPLEIPIEFELLPRAKQAIAFWNCQTGSQTNTDFVSISLKQDFLMSKHWIEMDQNLLHDLNPLAQESKVLVGDVPPSWLFWASAVTSMAVACCNAPCASSLAFEHILSTLQRFWEHRTWSAPSRIVQSCAWSLLRLAIAEARKARGRSSCKAAAAGQNSFHCCALPADKKQALIDRVMKEHQWQSGPHNSRACLLIVKVAFLASTTELLLKPSISSVEERKEWSKSCRCDEFWRALQLPGNWMAPSAFVEGTVQWGHSRSSRPWNLMQPTREWLANRQIAVKWAKYC